MKLKYYLRGVGIGIIFATLVMTVSALVHKYNISDEYIIREARKLGMVMKNELNVNGGLWGDNNSDEIEEESQDTEDTEDTEESQDTQVAGSETTPSESEPTPEPPVESEVPDDPEPPVESESESETVNYATVVIISGDYARQVAEKVRDAGLIEDAEDFRKYIGEMGYGKIMHPGTYQIPYGSTYEEICQILIKRNR